VTLRDTLQRHMFAGVRRVQLPDRLVDFTTVAEMETAIGNINAEIAKRSSTGTPPSFSLAVHSRE
jgi:hypothetical protein